MPSCRCGNARTLASDQAGQRSRSSASHEKTRHSDSSKQIADYVVEIIQDSNGNLWFGTISRGAARYDGRTLTYVTTESGLAGNTVSSVMEDKEGNLWFGTHSGVSRYDGKTFTNFTTKDGLTNNRTTRILSDQGGNIWLSSLDGVCCFNGVSFDTFRIPGPSPTGPPAPLATGPFQLPGQQWIRDMIEDQDGNIWLARDGYGACKYDGRTIVRHPVNPDRSSGGARPNARLGEIREFR
jgi:ligand-binding sensor domain-containing protein